MIPFLVTPDMVMSFPLYISSFQKVRFYFKTEVENNVLGSWTHEHVQPQKYQALKRLLGINHEKVNFLHWWLVFKLSNSAHDTWLSSEIQQL